MIKTQKIKQLKLKGQKSFKYQLHPELKENRRNELAVIKQAIKHGRFERNI